MIDNRLRPASPRVVVPWLCALFVACPLLALAQQGQPSLADLARKEQERRDSIKVTSKVYSDKDIKPSDPPPATAEKPAGATPVQDAAPAGATDNKPQEAGGTKDKAWWKNRIDTTTEDIRRNEAFAEALQTRVNALTTDFVNRDDPSQRAKVAEDRQKALAEIERVKGEITRLKKQIDTIEEEARKAGVPAGWLR